MRPRSSHSSQAKVSLLSAEQLESGRQCFGKKIDIHNLRLNMGNLKFDCFPH